MLNSIREIFDIAGIPFESMKFVQEKFDNQNSIIDAINHQKKCPAILGAKIDFSSHPFTVECVHQTWAKPTTARCKKITTASRPL